MRRALIIVSLAILCVICLVFLLFSHGNDLALDGLSGEPESAEKIAAHVHQSDASAVDREASSSVCEVKVVDALSSAAIEGATVVCASGAFATDVNGRVQVATMPMSRGSIAVWKDGYRPGFSTVLHGSDVVVQLSPSAGLKVQVVDLDGIPIANSRLSLAFGGAGPSAEAINFDLDSKSIAYMRAAETGRFGNATFGGLAIGEHIVKCEAAGYLPKGGTMMDSAGGLKVDPDVAFLSAHAASAAD